MKLCFRRLVPLEVTAPFFSFFTSFFTACFLKLSEGFGQISQDLTARLREGGEGGHSKGNDVTRPQTGLTHQFQPAASAYITPPADMPVLEEEQQARPGGGAQIDR